LDPARPTVGAQGAITRTIAGRTELDLDVVLLHRVREAPFGIALLGRGVVELDKEKQFDVSVLVEKIKSAKSVEIA